MSFWSLIGVTTAHAATTAPAAQQPGSFLSMLPILAIFILFFYLLLVRPQSKRAKEHRRLMDSLSIGDEVVTTGGVVGRLTKLRDSYVVLSIAQNVEMTLQKGAIAMVLPKGTLESI